MLIRRMEASSRTLVPYDPACSREVSDEGREAAAPAVPESGVIAPDEPVTQPADPVVVLEERLAREQAKREAAVEAAFEKGLVRGRHEARETDAERLEALRQGLLGASTRCTEALDQKADLAMLIAREAIQRILGGTTARTELVEDIVRSVLAELTAGAVLAVRVSAEDFPSDDTLAALALSLNGVVISRDENLRAGSCFLDLSLGSIDASLDTQLRELDEELGRLTGPMAI